MVQFTKMIFNKPQNMELIQQMEQMSISPLITFNRDIIINICKICDCNKISVEIKDGYVNIVTIHENLHLAMILRQYAEKAKETSMALVTQIEHLNQYNNQMNVNVYYDQLEINQQEIPTQQENWHLDVDQEQYTYISKISVKKLLQTIYKLNQSDVLIFKFNQSSIRIEDSNKAKFYLLPCAQIINSKIKTMLISSKYVQQIAQFIKQYQQNDEILIKAGNCCPLSFETIDRAVITYIAPIFDE